MCRYCPTGVNWKAVQIKIIKNEKKVQKLSDFTVEYCTDLINQVEPQITQLTAEGEEIPRTVDRKSMTVQWEE